jgi:CheY-like chemotaxis protein
MRILIAEDDLVSRRLLELTLIKLGYEVVVTSDGNAALQVLEGADPPKLAILDWMMPGMDGVEVCRKLRTEPTARPTYIIMLTAKTNKESLVTGLDGGADDYIGKPFDREELRARLQVGRRIVDLQGKLAERVLELEQALSQVRQLQGLLPICCYCKKIRDDSNYWQQVEGYIASHTGARFSHGICPDCWTKEVLPQIGGGELSPPPNPSRLESAKPSL